MHLLVGIAAFIAIYALGCFTEGYFRGELGVIQRLSGLIVFLLLVHRCVQ